MASDIDKKSENEAIFLRASPKIPPIIAKSRFAINLLKSKGFVIRFGS